MARKSGLGVGLDALFADNSTSDNNTTTVKLVDIEPNKYQPRKEFDENALTKLADSISQHGIIQPLLVRPLENGRYQIVVGERRWRASRMIGLAELPVVIREMNDTQVMEVALIENLQREDLNPVEEALGYKDLIEKFGLTQDEVSKRVGRSRSAVTNSLRLLNLPEKVIKMVSLGEISQGHAKTLLSIDNEKELFNMSNKVVETGMSVRELEKQVKAILVKGNETQQLKKAIQNSFYKEVEIALNEELSRKIKISENKNKGTIQIEFYNREELIDIANKLSNK